MRHLSTRVVVLTKLKTALDVFVRLRHPAWRKENVIIRYYVNKVSYVRLYNQIIHIKHFILQHCLEKY